MGLVVLKDVASCRRPLWLYNCEILRVDGRQLFVAVNGRARFWEWNDRKEF